VAAGAAVNIQTDRAKEIFLDALEIGPPDDRRAFLDRACGGGAALRREVEDLLAHHTRVGSFLHSVAPGLPDAVEQPTGEGPGTVAGPYKLLEQIGEGGFGVVFQAEQDQPVRRQVALKILKPGMDSRRVIVRFEAERQALALMDHPNIAKVLDAGTTTAGRPYFVMELVKGVPITTYSDGHHLTLPERLELFVSVCRAVQHAHQKGVIHRDLKPSNVLVTVYDGRPVPKVIDFGVAKATGPEWAGWGPSTESGGFVGTLEYMSPEQAEPNQPDVDTRSDVYSLGALLYELITCTTPLDRERVRGSPLLEVLRLIREEEPPRPSSRLSAAEGSPGVAAGRGLGSERLSGLVRGELDWIVMKCLEKDRDRRYQTADGLARDLERYLADEPVEACPPSAGYRLRKFVRKNRRLLGTAAAFAAVLLLGGAVTARQAVQLARAEREEAERAGAQAWEQARRGREVDAALTRARELREQARSAAGRSDQWAEAQAMARRAEALLEDGAAEPELTRQVQGLLRELAEEEADRRLVARLEAVRLSQAEVDVKGDQFVLERALPEYRQAFRDYGLEAAVAPEEAAALLRRPPPAVRGTLVAALDHWLILARYRKAPEAGWLERVLTAADQDPWRQGVRAARGRNDRAALERLAREVDAAAQPPEELFLLDLSLRQRGAKEGAVDLLQRAQEAFPGDFWINHDLGMALQTGDPPRYEDAVRFLTAAVALRPKSVGARLNLGTAFFAHGRLDEAIGAFRAAIGLKPDYAMAHNNLGLALVRKGQPDEAIGAFRRAIELNPDLAVAHCNLGSALRRQGEFARALAALQRGHELGSHRPGWPHPSVRWVQECRRLVELDGRVEAVLRGEEQPADAVERNEFAQVCFDKHLYAASARLRAEAFRADPALADDPEGGSRYAAACAAALVAAGRGADAGRLGGEERARWREQALDWLRADLAANARLLKGRNPEIGRLVGDRLRHWQGDPDLVGLRDPVAVAELPAGEREACRELWAEVRALLGAADAAR
jgi:serine/threonine protein kinase